MSNTLLPAQVAALSRFEAAMIRARLARATRSQYLQWARRFATASPAGGTPEERVAQFISTLSGHSVATQKQALNALAGQNGLFALLGRPLEQLPAWVNAKRPVRVSTWTTTAEVESLLPHLAEPWATVIGLLFGSGPRIHECLSLRWRDIDLERLTVTIRGGKGDKDRVTVLSARMVQPLKQRLLRCRGLWEEDRSRRRPGVYLPPTVARKYPAYATDLPWFWIFPQAGESRDPETGIVRRHHLHPKSFARPLRIASRRAGLTKRITAHSFRHGFATAYLLAGGNLRELQTLLGHASIETTEIYLHCIPKDSHRIGSPWDAAPSIVPFAAPASPAARRHA